MGDAAEHGPQYRPVGTGAHDQQVEVCGALAQNIHGGPVDELPVHRYAVCELLEGFVKVRFRVLTGPRDVLARRRGWLARTR